MSKPILVTGCSGRIGKSVCNELAARGHTVRGFDIRPNPALQECIVGDLTDVDAVHRAMQGVGCVIHLAATPDEAEFMDELLPNNLVGVYNILEVARKASVDRVVLTSSLQMNWAHPGPFPITTEMPITPTNWYASTKAFAEAAGRAYSIQHSMQIVIVRPGWCPREKEQVKIIAGSNDFQDLYFSPGDAGRLFACIAEAELTRKFCIVFGASQWVHRPYVDLDTPKRLFGYEPQDKWPEGVEVVDGATEVLGSLQ